MVAYIHWLGILWGASNLGSTCMSEYCISACARSDVFFFHKITTTHHSAYVSLVATCTEIKLNIRAILSCIWCYIILSYMYSLQDGCIYIHAFFLFI